MKTESTVDTAVVTRAMRRTHSGWWRATNMMSTAPTNGAHVMIDRTGNGITRSPQPPLGQHEEQQDAERDPVDVVLRLSGLDSAQPVAGPQRQSTQHVEHAVHQVAVRPADQAREGEQHTAVQAGEDGVEEVAAPREGIDRPQRGGDARGI